MILSGLSRVGPHHVELRDAIGPLARDRRSNPARLCPFTAERMMHSGDVAYGRRVKPCIREVGLVIVSVAIRSEPPEMVDSDLVRQFEACTLPLTEWTHRAHVKVAFVNLSAFSFEDALDRIRKGVVTYNVAHSIAESPTSGYNETTPRAFLQMIATTMAVYGRVVPATDADAFCDAHPHLLARHVLRLFYSPERR